MRTLEHGAIARKFDHRSLHAETDAEIRHARFARMAHRHDLAFDATFAKSTRHQNRIHAREQINTGLFHIL